MSLLALSDSFEYLCCGIYFNYLIAGIDYKRQILTSIVDPRPASVNGLYDKYHVAVHDFVVICFCDDATDCLKRRLFNRIVNIMELFTS